MEVSFPLSMLKKKSEQSSDATFLPQQYHHPDLVRSTEIFPSHPLNQRDFAAYDNGDPAQSSLEVM